MFGTRAWQLSIDGFSVVTYWSSRNSGCVGCLEAQWSAGQTHFSRGTDFDTTPEHFQLRGHLLTPVLAHFLSLALLHHCGSVSFSVIPVVPPLPGDSKQCLFLFWLHNKRMCFFLCCNSGAESHLHWTDLFMDGVIFQQPLHWAISIYLWRTR